jgi:hypothetical protein
LFGELGAKDLEEPNGIWITDAIITDFASAQAVLF